MMKFKKGAVQAPSKGTSYEGLPELTVPSRAMSLKEILERFTRNEALPLGKEVAYHESDDDLEKIAKSDLVDRAEFVDKLKETQLKHAKQEKAREAKARADARAKIEAEEKAKFEAKKVETKDSTESAK